MHPNAQRVQEALHRLGAKCEVVELESSTRTAVEAAQAAGCEVGQIVKSLVFIFTPDGQEKGEPVLILVSGTNRVHEKRFGRFLGGKVTRADPETVHEISGFAIGGVPPVGLNTPVKTFIDEDLLQYETVWAAAGTPNAVFQIAPQELVKITGAQVAAVK
ncbi:MAG: YbaK/EbsC family protein [Chloroflexi bacterium]|nr:YbaK/EbsC family protein [Chloroflexota bacterium]